MVTRKKGRADLGADLLVELEVGSIPHLLQTLVVQVKSYTGELDNLSAVEDVKRAFDAYSTASMGLIVSTATSRSKLFQDGLDKLEEDSKKPVALLMGADLAAFFLHYGGGLLS